VNADCCIIVTPARAHAAAAIAAAEHGVPILCEKPLADTWQACTEIYHALRRTKQKMMVVQNYRYRAPMLAMQRVLQSGALGRINYMAARFADDCREFDSWKRRHGLPHAMLLDGAAHHLDMLRHLSGADCANISAQEWNPPWSSSTGEFCALCLLRMSNDVRASYEGNATAAGDQHPWGSENYRVECEAGSVSVGQGLVTQDVPAPVPTHEAHAWIVNEFLDWLDGGREPATTLDDNIRTAAMIFGAIESARTGQSVDVQAMLKSLHAA
jgi:predicted dehydrogenase